MLKNIRKVCALVVLLSVLFSCASSSLDSKALMYDKSQESDEYLKRRSQEKLNDENDDRMVTYSVSLKLSVKNPDETRAMLLKQVKNNNGFIVKETENFIMMRIPSANMDNFINNARILGKIENETKTGTDITDQYRDNVIRLESLKSVRDRYLTLLNKANAVNDILSIEKELERVNTQIEILEGKIKYAESSVTYSSITVLFGEKAKPGPVGWIFYGLYHGIKWLFVWN